MIGTAPQRPGSPLIRHQELPDAEQEFVPFTPLKQWRGIATRYDKTGASSQAVVTLASPLMSGVTL
ncbi:hypothetical protein OG285_13475 [Streptomyces sp. NBC_01471]|uniref:hypothetical protein n=1 Tax=Streptomyces sp. NBC_01471 TaxID=2903879 RepID=UPI003252DFE2